MQKGFAPIFILLGILVLATVAGGAYYFGKSQAPKPQAQKSVIVSQAPKATPASDEIANWKIYTDQNNAFTFQYPQDWQIRTQEKPNNQQMAIVEVYKQIGGGVEPLIYSMRIYKADPKGAVSAEAYVDKVLESLETQNLGKYPLKRKNISVDGRNGEWVVGFPSRSGDIEVFVPYKEALYKFIFEPYDESVSELEPEKYLELFTQILSTFKFIN